MPKFPCQVAVPLEVVQSILHLKGLEAMGAKITQTAGYIEAKADRLQGAHIYMDFPSVGATQKYHDGSNLADGTTVIEKRPANLKSWTWPLF